jgi:hypothetical protein
MLLKKKSICVPSKNNILVQNSKILPTISPSCEANPPVDAVLKKWENERCENLKWLKSGKLEDLEDVIWIGQVHTMKQQLMKLLTLISCNGF